MRKKSHISLARYIVHNSDDENLKKHKYSFYLGSILPDCKPSFVYRKHEMDGTFPDVKVMIDRLINGKNQKPVVNKKKYYVNLGQVTHFVADYFTFPHNKTYEGSLKDHCSYEEVLKKRLREYLKKGKDKRHRTIGMEFQSPEKLCDFIQHSHDKYLERKLNIDEDIRHIISVNHVIVEGISALLRKVHHKAS